MSPRSLLQFVLFIGICLFIASLCMPYYHDPLAAEQLHLRGIDMNRAEYFKQEAALSTCKRDLMDLGAGLTIAAGMLLYFLVARHVYTFADLKNLKTLTRLRIYAGTNIAWLLMLPGTVWYYVFHMGRGDYPAFADSIGIPLMEQLPVFLFLLIPLNLFLFLSQIRSRLPVKLFVRANVYKLPAILWEIYFGFFLLLNLCSCVAFITGGDHVAIPVNLYFTLVLLSLRAGQISKW